MSVEYRRAVADDLDVLMGLEQSLFANDAWSRELMAAELANPQCLYLVAEQSGEVVAYSGIVVAPGGPESDVQTIAVVAEARRQGIARELMRLMLDEASSRGARETFLEVRVDNPGAQALYELLGFVGIAVRPRYYMPDGVDALVMKKELP